MPKELIKYFYTEVFFILITCFSGVIEAWGWFAASFTLTILTPLWIGVIILGLIGEKIHAYQQS